MSEDALSPEAFGAAFKSFLTVMTQHAQPPVGTLQQRIAAHLGADPSKLPVFADEFDPYEHPNVQVAIDAMLTEHQDEAELVGIAAQQPALRRTGSGDDRQPGSAARHATDRRRTGGLRQFPSCE